MYIISLNGMFLLLSLRSIYISLDGNDERECSFNNRCSYQRAKHEINEKSNIFLNDFEISKTQDLLNFRDLFQHSMKYNCNIDGNNIIINGSELNSPLNLFLFMNNLHPIENDKICIKNIAFIKFSETVLSIRNSTGISFNNLQFKSCSNDRKISTISIVSSNLEFQNFQLIKCTAHDSSIISIFNSDVSFVSSKIYQNFVFHESKQPMFMIIKSNITFKDSTFSYNTSPVSPFTRLEELSHIYYQNNTFYMNKHAELILSDGYRAETSIQSCDFENNHGILFISSTKAIFSFYNNNVKEYCSFDYSLISLFNSTASISSNLFSNCAGLNLIHSSNTSNIKSESNRFINCKPYTSIYHSTLYSTNEISNCSFANTISKHSILYIEKNSHLTVGKTIFDKSWSPVLYALSKSDIFLQNVVFNESFATYKRALYGSKSFISLKQCTFHDESLKSLISLSNGTILMENLYFKAPQKFALSGDLLHFCTNCDFGSYKIQNSSTNITFITMFSLLFIFVICILILRKRKIRNLFNRSVNKIV